MENKENRPRFSPGWPPSLPRSVYVDDRTTVRPLPVLPTPSYGLRICPHHAGRAKNVGRAKIPVFLM
eukprot:3938468-Prymnesium_polylepis.1